jgi:hypothetical protein
MGRKKLNLQWISKDASRRAMLNKRRQGLIKKTSELSKLCGVRPCAMVYGENEVRPEVWPIVPVAKNLLASFKNTAEFERWTKKTGQEDFLRQRINKLQDMVRRFDLDSQGRETLILFHESMAGRCPSGLLGVTPIELIRLHEVWRRKMKAVTERLQQLAVQQVEQQPLPRR